jgi:hypothetical protein
MNSVIENQINKLPKKERSVTDYIFSNPYFLRSQEFGSTISNFKETISFNNNASKNYIYFVFGFVSIIMGLRSFEDKFSLEIFLTSIVILVFTRIYYQFKKKEFININVSGIKIKSDFFQWDQIYDYGFTIIPKTKSSVYILEIFGNDISRKSYELHGFNNPEEIIKTMNFFRNRYNSKQTS